MFLYPEFTLVCGSGRNDVYGAINEEGEYLLEVMLFLLAEESIAKPIPGGDYTGIITKP
jgi:hypothetical protein